MGRDARRRTPASAGGLPRVGCDAPNNTGCAAGVRKPMDDRGAPCRGRSHGHSNSVEGRPPGLTAIPWPAGSLPATAKACGSSEPGSRLRIRNGPRAMGARVIHPVFHHKPRPVCSAHRQTTGKSSGACLGVAVERHDPFKALLEKLRQADRSAAPLPQFPSWWISRRAAPGPNARPHPSNRHPPPAQGNSARQSRNQNAAMPAPSLKQGMTASAFS